MRRQAQPRPSTHQPACPRFALAPCPSYRQFVQEALARIIKVGEHAEPVDSPAQAHRLTSRLNRGVALHLTSVAGGVGHLWEVDYFGQALGDVRPEPSVEEECLDHDVGVDDAPARATRRRFVR